MTWRLHHFSRPLSARLSSILFLVPPTVVFFLAPSRGGLEWPYSLKAPLNIYDEGHFLALVRFSGVDLLPYRDLWTLYGPGTSVLGVLLDPIVGRNMIVYRILNILVLSLLLVGLYKVVARFSGPWLSVVLVSFIATASPPQFHFARALTFVVWGTWFVLTSDTSRSPRRIAAGCALIGFAFLGRYEFVLVSIGLVLLVALHARKFLDAAGLRRVILAGLAPPSLFILWCLAFVPWPALYENFINYPFRFYPRPECRGLPTVWSESFTSLAGPIHGRMWNGRDLLLVFGNLVAPLAALTVLAISLRGTSSSLGRSIKQTIGLLTLFIFLQMRPRNGTSPEAAVPLTLLCLAILIFVLRRRRAGVARVVGALLGIAVGASSIVSLPRDSITAWSDWGPYDPVVGFKQVNEGTLYDDDVIAAVKREVDKFSNPGTPIFVALRTNRGHFANASALYWLLDRPPASRFIEFNPCLTDRDDVQSDIVRDISEIDVVVATSFFPAEPPLGRPAAVLDRYLDSNFEQKLAVQVSPMGEQPTYYVLVRKAVSPRP